MIWSYYLDEKDSKRDTYEEDQKQMTPEKVKTIDRVQETNTSMTDQVMDDNESFASIELSIKYIEKNRKEYYEKLDAIKHELEIQKAVYMNKAAFFDKTSKRYKLES